MDASSVSISANIVSNPNIGKMAKRIKRHVFNTVLIHIGSANSGLSECLQVSHLNFWLLMTLLTQRIQLSNALKLHGGWDPSHGYHFLAGDFSNGASSHPSHHQPFEFFHSEVELGRVSSSFLAFFFFSPTNFPAGFFPFPSKDLAPRCFHLLKERMSVRFLSRFLLRNSSHLPSQSSAHFLE